MKSHSERLLFERHALKRITLDWLRDPIQYDRLMIIKRYLDTCSDGYILDDGCGESEPLVISNNERTIGLDISKTALLNLKAKTFKGEIVLGSVTELPFRDGVFQRAVCSEVIEHLPTDSDVLRCIKELNRVTRQFMITTPNCRFGSDWYALSEPTHRRFFSIKALKKFLPPNAIYWTSNIPRDFLLYFQPNPSTRSPFIRKYLLSNPKTKLFSFCFSFMNISCG